MTVARTLAEWALALRLDDVPASARDDAKLHLLDGIGCGIAASRLGEVSHAAAVARGFGGRPEATIIGSGGDRVSAPAAAFANGALIHALDFDDTHAGALVHATAAVAPTVLAVAEQTGASGGDALRAAIAAYETVIRLGAAVTHGFHARGFHATSVCGVFASALAASMLSGLDESRTVSALGIAGSAAAGSLEFLATGAATKQLHPGMAALNGIIAARLAQAGAEGPASIFEGEHGLFRSYASTDVNPLAITKTLGSEWEIHNVAIKRYPACHLSVASLETLRLMDVASRVRDVESITFAVPHGSVPIVCEPLDRKRTPRTPYEAKFSLPWCAAALLLDGKLTVDSFADPGRDDVRTLASKIGYESVAIDGAPAAALGHATVRFADGSTMRTEPETAAPGDGRTDPPAVIDKFRDNGGTTALQQGVMNLEDRADVRGLLA